MTTGEPALTDASGPELVHSGITGLDDVLRGGFRRGSVILIEGGPGTGKSMLGVEFVYRGARELGEPGVIVLFDASPDRVMWAAAGFGGDLHALEEAGRLKIVLTTRRIFEQEVRQLDSRLLEEVREVGARRLFVDGLSAAAFSSLDRAHETVIALSMAGRRDGMTTMLALGTPSVSRTVVPTPSAVEFVADTIVRVRVETEGRVVGRSLEVVKSRGSEVEMGRHSMRIVDGRGVEVYPRMHTLLERARAVAPGYDPDVRLPTGVPGLDGLLNGGVYLASATLWAGDAGTGKSLAVLQFLAAGAERGEPGLLVAIEEPPAQAAANARVVGVELPALIDAGLIRVWHPAPGELEIDRHLYELERHLLEFQPRRVVVDSVSAHAASIDAGTRDLHDLLRSVIGLLKVSRATSIFTLETTPGTAGATTGTLADLSSLFDNVLRLRVVEDGDGAGRALSIVKLRATPARHSPHPYEIAHGAGLRVLPRSVLHEP